MTKTYEPHSLVIRNLAVLESAPEIVREVEKAVFSAVHEKIEAWIAARENWDGTGDFPDGENCFGPTAWKTAENDKRIAWFAIGPESDGDDYEYWLSALLGIVQDKYGIWVNFNTTWITRQTGKGARPSATWKKYLAEQFPLTKLGALGFELEGEYLFLPIQVDGEALAEDYPGSLQFVLEPVDDALRKLEAAHTEIDILLKAAQVKFGE